MSGGTASATMPCIYDGLLQQQQQLQNQSSPRQQQQPGKGLGPKNTDDVIQPAPEPFKPGTTTVVNHNNNTINVQPQLHSSHRRNVSVTANCYLQMLTSPLKTFRERNNNNNATPSVEESPVDDSRKEGQEPQEKSAFQQDMETAMELVAAVGYALYAVTIALFVALIPRRFRYKDITDQVVLVTGAGSGIGRLMAKKLALNHGAVIVAWDINKTGTHSKNARTHLH